MKSFIRHKIGLWAVLTICLAVLLSACKFSSGKTPTPPPQTTPVETSAVTQTEAVELLEELFALPEETVAEKETSESSKMLYLLNEQSRCDIQAIHEDSIELSITTPDLRAIFMEQIDETGVYTDPVAESARMMEAVLSRLESPDCPMVTNEVTAKLDLSGEEPEIVMSDELADAIYGNILTLFDELMSK